MKKNLVLFDDANRIDLLPLVFTKPVGELRVGIISIRQKWEHDTGLRSSTLTEPYLSGRFPLETARENLLVNASVLPAPELVRQVMDLSAGEALTFGERVIAQVILKSDLEHAEDGFKPAKIIPYGREIDIIRYPWDIFSLNGKEIERDHARLTLGRNTAALDDSCTLIGDNPLFIEEGAKIKASVINTGNGAVYFGKDSEVMEGTMIRGPFALCEGATVKMGAKIYGPTTIGPHSKVGGELNNVVITGYSNKAHDGFLGNSVIGEWCNIGADSNTSNLKNTYDKVKMWNYREERFIDSGLQFCGLIMGDHSKCGINTMFNTGTVIGASCNIFGPGFQRNFVPSFSWGGTSGFQLYNLNKAMKVAETVMKRRGMMFDEHDRKVFEYLHELSRDKIRQ